VAVVDAARRTKAIYNVCHVRQRAITMTAAAAAAATRRNEDKDEN